MKNRMLILLILTLTAFFTMACRRTKPSLHNGDLIFVGLPAGYDAATGSMDAAIASATGEEGGKELIHVAIAEVQDGKVWIIDATIKHGVDRHPLDTFLTDFTLGDGSLPEFIVKRVKGVDADAAVKRARTLCGRAYDKLFLPDNKELYCTELVQACYQDKDGQPVFLSKPMNFLAPDGSLPPYWEWLFESMGAEVPQGIPGTNPADMAQSPLLEDVPIKNLEKLR